VLLNKESDGTLWDTHLPLYMHL